MNSISSYIVPILIFIVICVGVYKKEPVFTLFLQGAKSGIDTVISILPALVGLVVAVEMFSSSGALDLISCAFGRVFYYLGFPSELLPLALLRPVSGSGTLSILNKILTDFSPNSFIGDVACVMCGSSETTFYATAVYFGCVGIKNTRHTIACAIIADIVSIVLSVATVRLFLY